MSLNVKMFRRKDIKRSLDLRREKKVDPYRQGWKHVENPQNIDLNAVKLCFHVSKINNSEIKNEFNFYLTYSQKWRILLNRKI